MLETRTYIITVMAARLYCIPTRIKSFSPVVRTQTAEGFSQRHVRIVKGTELFWLRRVFLFICDTKGQLMEMANQTAYERQQFQFTSMNSIK